MQLLRPDVVQTNDGGFSFAPCLLIVWPAVPLHSETLEDGTAEREREEDVCYA